MNTQKGEKISKGEKTDWHRIRGMHKLAFEEVCSFISENVVRKRNSYFLHFLNELFTDSVANNDPSKLIQIIRLPDDLTRIP